MKIFSATFLLFFTFVSAHASPRAGDFPKWFQPLSFCSSCRQAPNVANLKKSVAMINRLARQISNSGLSGEFTVLDNDYVNGIAYRAYGETTDGQTFCNLYVDCAGRIMFPERTSCFNTSTGVRKFLKR